jgi:phage tail-like protein
MPQNDPYSSAQFVLELDEKQVGFCRSIEGGGVKADILTYRQVQQGQWAFSRQLAAKPKFEDIKIQVGMAMSEDFYEWIEDFFRGVGQDGTISRKNGAISSGDFHYRERYRRTFYEALISEVAIPKLDASDRNAAYMGVTIVPEALEFVQGDGKDLSEQVKNLSQKLWTPNNFGFEVKGFEDALKRVTRIDGFTIKQQILEYPAGSGATIGGPVIHTGPGVMRVPGMIEFPNIAVYVPEADAKPMVDHFTTYGIRHSQAPNPLTGRIEFYGQDLGVLCTIEMNGMDIASIVPDRADSTSHDVKQVKIEFTCEQMEFSYKRQNVSGAPAA